MKESRTSLRLIFGLIGLMNLYGLLSALGYVTFLPDLFDGMFEKTMFGFVYAFIYGFGSIIFAIALPQFLTTSRVKYVKVFVVAMLALSIVSIAMSASAFLDSVVSLLIEVVFTWYVVANVSKFVDSN